MILIGRYTLRAFRADAFVARPSRTNFKIAKPRRPCTAKLTLGPETRAAALDDRVHPISHIDDGHLIAPMVVIAVNADRVFAPRRDDRDLRVKPKKAHEFKEIFHSEISCFIDFRTRGGFRSRVRCV